MQCDRCKTEEDCKYVSIIDVTTIVDKYGVTRQIEDELYYCIRCFKDMMR